MKLFAAVCMSLLILFDASTIVAGTSHVYKGGLVSDINEIKLVVSGEVYRLANVVNVINVVKRNRSYYEEPGRLRDVRPGDPVNVKVFNGEVTEIVVERWKQ
jgi:hypothetical protein